MNYLSNIAKNYPASGIRKMFDLAQKYDDVIKLTVGEPNFDTPVNVKEAAKKAIDEGYTHYAPNAGLPELREAIAKEYTKYSKDYTLDNVMITVGGMEAITMCLIATVNPGDEVIIPDPGFSNYVGQVMLAGAVPVGVPVFEENEFNIKSEDIEKAITPKTKAILLNSPSNPLGSVICKEEILKIAEIVKKHNLIVYSDEVYDKLIFDGIEYFSIAQVPEVKDQVLVINSFSKAYAMTGWRIGYIVGNKDIISNMPKLQEGLVSCVSTFTQRAALEAYTGNQEAVKQMHADYLRRRDILIDGLNNIPGITCKKSPGSFYAFANIKALGISSEQFAIDLVKNARVVVVPGSAFGSMGEGYFRTVFANSDENLIEAVRRIDEYVTKTYKF
ncbi:aminotransferase [Clostridium carboxidivorans P7]|uniref:Aminotransferase n=1 Tax=Clostridium carboxidivorans P7 TaxID=536227 RepID=C6PQ09_9CLOT|nr:pyridoxal phosphate-dependent aminotransferase [Clostridium carboxidivorans]AKN29611.1 aminotransferase [Clostridium carboxidivorans P7]EET88676.1 aminotransferase class I and II [Clostridium carboxidivorans P7]EFG89464.1 putative aspartate transaminase [Clostridium carboxidivorans P7]